MQKKWNVPTQVIFNSTFNFMQLTIESQTHTYVCVWDCVREQLA